MKCLPQYNRVKTLMGVTLVAAILITLGCNDRGNASGNGDNSSSDSNAPPTITLNGSQVVSIMEGEIYIELGAIAFDEEDGDLTSEIRITTDVLDNSPKGRYSARYSVQDSQGFETSAIRVIQISHGSESSNIQTHRLAKDTGANLDYLEYLPASYLNNSTIAAPLIIFNHGSGATGANLGAVECCGAPDVIKTSRWDSTLPFIVLSPQRKEGLNAQALKQFVEFAKSSYTIDSSQIYMIGWSQGANIAARYSTEYPEELAAVALFAGGFFQGVPDNICAAGDIPSWTFIGKRDNPFINSTAKDTHSAYQECNANTDRRITLFDEADHFTTSIWPLLAPNIRTTDPNYDQFEIRLVDWLLSHINKAQ